MAVAAVLAKRTSRGCSKSSRRPVRRQRLYAARPVAGKLALRAPAGLQGPDALVKEGLVSPAGASTGFRRPRWSRMTTATT